MKRLIDRLGWGIAGALGITVVAILGSVVSAGPLAPPGPPAATQETLIYEPTSCAGYPIFLPASGMYRLTENLPAAGCGADVIELGASNITLDLGGFAIYGDQRGIMTNVLIPEHTVIRNGVIEATGSSGIYLPSTLGVHVSDIQVKQAGLEGIRLGNNAIVENCRLSLNANVGLQVGTGSLVSACVFNNNSTGGVVAGDRSTILDCVADSNGATGITVGKYSVVSNCTASGNFGAGIFAGTATRISDCSASTNDFGIVAGGTALSVDGCVLTANGGDGIRVNGGCNVTNNIADGNGLVAVGAGIHVIAGSGCRIEDNNVINNDSGIDIDTAGNTVFNNSARNNGAAGLANEYTDIVGGNDLGPVGVAAAATSPWANIAY